MSQEPEDKLTEDELTALDISENRRLRHLGIDPNADPVDILTELMRREDAAKKDTK